MTSIFDLFRKSKQEKLERALELSRSIDILKSEIFSLKREFEEIKRSNENKLGILQNKATISKSEEELNINKSISERIEIRMRGADVEYEKEIVNKTRDIYLKKAELAKILKDSVVNDLFKSEEEKRQIGDSYELITQAYKQEKVSKEKFKEVRKKAEKKLDSKVYYSDIIVTNKKGEILLLKRNENDDMFPGKYCLPGGHIDPGEEGIEAAQRELQEETLIEQSIKKFQKIAELDKEKAHIEYFVLYLDETPQGITLNSREHSSYEWVSKESLEDYDTIGDLQDVFVELGYGVNNHIEIEKGIGHKYIRREGNVGNYSYIYKESDKLASSKGKLEVGKSGKIIEKTSTNPKQVYNGIKNFLDSINQKFDVNFSKSTSSIYMNTKDKYGNKFNIRFSNHSKASVSETEKIGVKSNYLGDGEWEVDIDTFIGLKTDDIKNIMKIVQQTSKEIDVDNIKFDFNEVYNNHNDAIDKKLEELKLEDDFYGVNRSMISDILEDYIWSDEYIKKKEEIDKVKKINDNFNIEGVNISIKDGNVKNIYFDNYYSFLYKDDRNDIKTYIYNFFNKFKNNDSDNIDKFKSDLAELINIKVKKLNKTIFSETIQKAEKIKGGLADGKTISSIAKKHKVTEDVINEQVKMGVKVEMEHTDDEDKAKEIVLDHLMESPKYYTLLAEMEKKFDKSEAAFTIIQKAFQEGKVGEDVFLKAQKVYKDNAENKKLGRVGKPWGKSGEEETKDTKGKKEENDGDKNKTIEEHARAATDQELEGAAAGGDEELRVAAKKEIERRETEHKPEEGNEYVEKFRSLSDEQVKFYIEAPHSKIKEAAKIVADERGLSVISKEDYIKQFEDYSDKSDKDISDFYKEENKLVKGKLSLKSNEKYDIAVNTYMGNGFVGIRFFLNDPDNFEENVKNHYNKTGRFVTRMDLNDVKSVSNDLSEFIEDNKISKDLVLHRMVLTGGTFFTKLKEGDIYEDKSFSSSSLKKLEHFGDFDIKILAKKGSNVSSINNPGEAEFLINKNSKFRVVEKHKDGLGITVELL